MPEHNLESNNPYQSPVNVIDPGAAVDSLTDAAMLKLLKDFRAQIHALGVVWIILGGLAWVAGLFAVAMFGPGSNGWVDSAIILSILGGLGSVWIALGILTCCKQMWAVYAGLVLSYISLAGNILRINICALVIAGFIIVQAHRVIRWAKQIQAAGIPLTTRPRDWQLRGTL